MKEIAQRNILVNGASSGIGFAVAQSLLKHKATVIASGRSKAKLQRLLSYASSVENIHLVSGDVTESKHLDEMFRCCRMKTDRALDGFVLCAGHGLPGTLLNSEQSLWQDLLEVNYLAVMAQLKQAATLFLADNEHNEVRDIVVIGSTIGRNVSAFNPVYGSTKFAVHSLVEALRQEVCHANIRVSLIEPGFVRSGFQNSANYDMQWFDALEKEMGPFLSPQDVANTVMFVLNQPSHVHIDDIRIRPTKQKV